MNILVRRTGALGDVVLATPVIRRLKRENPDARIFVQTAYPDVFRNNPRVEAINENILDSISDPVRVIDLDLAYERRPNEHIVDAYMLEAFGDVGGPADQVQELFLGPYKPVSLPPNAVAVHAAVAGWKNRTLPRETWKAVVTRLQMAGMFPILVGSPRDSLKGAPCTGFFSTDVLAQAALIESCRAFVGSDSGLLHVAGAMQVPVVGVFTCALPEYRLPRYDGAYGVAPHTLGCIGCLHKRPAPVTMEYCERGDNACVNEVSSSHIVDAVLRALK